LLDDRQCIDGTTNVALLDPVLGDERRCFESDFWQSA
jgi:hypothetical protein